MMNNHQVSSGRRRRITGIRLEQWAGGKRSGDVRFTCAAGSARKLNRARSEQDEVSAAGNQRVGAIRVIRPRLPTEAQIDTLIPSDASLFVRVNEPRGGSIYEINWQDGSVLRRFRAGPDESGVNVACVHQQKFLSFQPDLGHGTLVPLVGTAEPLTAESRHSCGEPSVRESIRRQ